VFPDCEKLPLIIGALPGSIRKKINNDKYFISIIIKNPPSLLMEGY
jgi:hypothetical protein